MSFTHVLNLSISASWLVLAVIAARFLLKRAPKALHCALWALVAFRLLCPISIESELSLLPTREVIPQEYLTMEPRDSGFSQSAALELVTNPIYDAPLFLEIEPTVDRVQHWDMIGTILWLTGIGAMGIYAAYTYLSLRLRVRMAARLRGNLWECDEIDSPFILGLIRPRIYLPSGLAESTRAHVLAHENAHLKRLDHLWKPLSFALLAVHWFNPVMWLGYGLLCRDIELACDERVIRNLSKTDVRAYSESLILCTVPHRSIAMCPLAFGEVGVKGRIKAMVHYRKPGFWIVSIAVLTAAVIALCFLTDPAKTPDSIAQLLERRDCAILGITEQSIQLEIRKADLPENVLNGRKHRFDEAPIVLQEYDDTTLSITEARMSGDELVVTIALEHQLGEEGSLLLPYHPHFEDYATTVRMEHHDVTDTESRFDDAAQLRGSGRTSFSIGIKADVWNQANGYIRFQLEGLYNLKYGLGYNLETTDIEIIDTVRIFRAEGIPSFTAPQFQLHTDGTFILIPNAFTSYLAWGTYTLEDGILTMKTDDGRFVYTFLEEDGAYLYDRSRSNDLEYYRDARTAAALPDRAQFTLTDRWQFASEELDGHITGALEKLFGESETPEQLRTISYQILDFAQASGTPLQGSTGHTDYLTVELAALFQCYDRTNGKLSEGTDALLFAAMTFRSAGDSMELIAVMNTDEKELQQVLGTDALEFWNDQKDTILQTLSDRCLANAQGQLTSPAIEMETQQLLTEICSSPAQSSNPGAYIEAHREEYDRLISLGADTVRYCFAQFAEGGQIGLTGHIMALCCREIISPFEDTYENGIYMTGQDWFDAFAANAQLLLEVNDANTLQSAFPYHAMALEALGIL